MTISTQYNDFHFSLSQLEQFLFLFRQLPKESQDVRDAIKSKGDDYWLKLTRPYYWSKFYDRSLLDLLYAVMLTGGFSEPLPDDSDPHKQLQAMLDSAIEPPKEDWDGGTGKKYEFKEFMGCLYSLMRTIECLSVYGQSLNALLIDVANGSDDALFKIIRIDRSALSHPTIADRLARAELEQDEQFFKTLSSALSGKTAKQNPEYRDLRYTLAVLVDIGLLDQLSIDQRYQLLCVDLGLYPHEGKDPAGSLDKFILRWRKEFLT